MYGDKKKNLILFLSLMIIGLTISSCTPQDTDANAQDRLKEALSNRLSQQNFAFKGISEIRVAGVAVQPSKTFEGTVMDRNRLFLKVSSQPDKNGVLRGKGVDKEDNRIVFTRDNHGWVTDQAINISQEAASIRWNPVQAMERLQSAAKQVSVNRDLTDPQMIVLDIKVDGKQLTEQVKSEFTPSAEQWISSERLQRLKIEYGLTDRDLERMRGEMQQKISSASGQLNDMLASLSAGGLYRIWINRQSNIPQQLREETQMNYNTSGKQVEETSVIHYYFSDT